MDSYPVSLLESPQAVSGRPLSARTRPASCFHNRNCERPVENLRGFEEHFRLYPLTDQLRCWLTAIKPSANFHELRSAGRWPGERHQSHVLWFGEADKN